MFVSDVQWLASAGPEEVPVLQAIVIVALGGKQRAWSAAREPAAVLKAGRLRQHHARLIEVLIALAARSNLDPYHLPEPALPKCIRDVVQGLEARR